MNEDARELFSSASKLWAELAEKKDFRAIIDSAIDSYITFRAMSDADGFREAALGAINVAIEALDGGADTAKPHVASDLFCSFCGTGVADIKPPTNSKDFLIAGPNVFICRNCVELTLRVFAAKDDVWADKAAELIRQCRSH